jgi:hypothetical protein
MRFWRVHGSEIRREYRLGRGANPAGHQLKISLRKGRVTGKAGLASDESARDATSRDFGDPLSLVSAASLGRPVASIIPTKPNVTTSPLATKVTIAGRIEGASDGKGIARCSFVSTSFQRISRAFVAPAARSAAGENPVNRAPLGSFDLRICEGWRSILRKFVAQACGFYCAAPFFFANFPQGTAPNASAAHRVCAN